MCVPERYDGMHNGGHRHEEGPHQMPPILGTIEINMCVWQGLKERRKKGTNRKKSAGFKITRSDASVQCCTRVCDGAYSYELKIQLKYAVTLILMGR